MFCEPLLWGSLMRMVLYLYRVQMGSFLRCYNKYDRPERNGGAVFRCVSVCMYTQLPNNYEKHRKHNDKTLSFVATSIIAGVCEINPRFFRNISKWVWFEVNCVFGFMFIINGPLTSIRPSIVSIFRSYILNLYTYPLLCFKIIFSSVDLIMYTI